MQRLFGALPLGRRRRVSKRPDSGLPAWQGRSAGAHFDWPKWAKSHLGRSPLRTSLGYETGTASILWPTLALVGSHRWPGKSIEKYSLLCEIVPLLPGPHPGVRRFRRREPDYWQLGIAAHQGKALEVEGLFLREVGIFCRITCPSMCLHQTKGQKEKNAGTSCTAGWIPQGGGRPRLWRSLVTFWRQKVTPAERPHQAGGLERKKEEGNLS